MSKIIESVKQLVEPIIAANAMELVDVEYKKLYGQDTLIIYIDKDGGITVDDCETISRKLGEWLDEEDFISDSYILEVSSPGLGRPLKKEKDFVRSMGKDVEVRLYKPLNKQKEYRGALKSYDADTVTITLEDGGDLPLAKSDIALIRLAFDF